MNTITFAGITGTVLESSPHGNYLVVQLSKRIVICGTYSNQFYWEESHDEDSGFASFITYIGLRTQAEFEKFKAFIITKGGYFHPNEMTARRAKRVNSFPLEIKVRGLEPAHIKELLSYR